MKAQDGKVWLCLGCGKTNDDDSDWKGGWDESCMLNCIQVDAKTKTPTPEQVQEFNEKKARHLNMPSPTIQDFLNTPVNVELMELIKKRLKK